MSCLRFAVFAPDDLCLLAICTRYWRKGVVGVPVWNAPDPMFSPLPISAPVCYLLGTKFLPACRYEKMLKVGIPEGAVRLKMQGEGIDPARLFKD